MLRMVIVDDEPWAALGLSQIVDWESLGFSLLGMFYSGREAMEVIAREKPDVVFTDIRMKGMTGLQLIAEAQKAGARGCRYVLVSAYEDFEAARAALRLGAFGYITKPLDPDEVQELAGRLREQIGQERRPLFLTTDRTKPFPEGDAPRRLSEILAYPYALMAMGDLAALGDVFSGRGQMLPVATDGGMLGALIGCERPALTGQTRPEGCGRSTVRATNSSAAFGGLDYPQMAREAIWPWKCRFTFCDTQLIAQIQAFLCENMAAQHSIDQLARQFHIAPSHLSFLFKKNVGATIVRFRQHIRMHWAEWLMEDEAMKLGAIARRVGYADYNYFSRVFSSAHQGRSPEAFRRELRAGRQS